MQLQNVIYGTLCRLHNAMKGDRKACQLYGLKVSIGMTEILLIMGYLNRDNFCSRICLSLSSWYEENRVFIDLYDDVAWEVIVILLFIFVKYLVRAFVIASYWRNFLFQIGCFGEGENTLCWDCRYWEWSRLVAWWMLEWWVLQYFNIVIAII